MSIFNIKKWFAKKEKVDKVQEFIEKEFKNGNVVLPTDKRDYVDYEDFKIKTSEIPSIQEKLNKIERR